MVAVPLSAVDVCWICITLVAAVGLSSFLMSRTGVLPGLDVPSSRHGFIDGLRGVAAVLVFLNHAPLVMVNTEIVPQCFYIASYRFGTAAGALGVQVFFCITGFLFFEKLIEARGRLDCHRFYANRVKRLVPLYCFAVTTAVVIAWIVKGPFEANLATLRAGLRLYAFGFLPVQNLGEFEMPRLLGTTWSLPYEWRFYFLLPVLAWLTSEPRTRRPAFLTILVLALLQFATEQIAVWPFFLSGYMAAVACSWKVEIGEAVCLGIGVVALALLSAPVILDIAPYGLARFGLVSVGFVLLTLAKPTFLGARTLRYVGEISYSFYLLQVPIMYALFYSLKQKGNAGAITYNSFLGWMAAIAMLTVLISTVTFRFVEYPFMKKKDSAARTAHNGPPAASLAMSRKGHMAALSKSDAA
jgi:peptidoglycan/LPS O-acetylase OafA/YrhL